MDKMLEEVRTARLLLRRMGPSDYGAFIQMHQNSRVMSTLGGVRRAEELKPWFDRVVGEWSRLGYSWWSVREVASGQFVGRGGLRRLTIEGREEVEVGYGFLPEFWGRGYATELARESVRIGFTQLKLPELISFTQVTNLASRRVMEKAGFRYERDFTYANTPHVLYRQPAPAT
jgi:RimJ/RimL family protein N-acetyltransferase